MKIACHISKRTRLGASLLVSLSTVILLACESSAPVSQQQTYTDDIKDRGGQVETQQQGVWPRPLPEGEEIAVAKDLVTKNYYVILDGSGSMHYQGCSGNVNKAQASKKALDKFISLLPQEANLGLLVFDRKGTSERIPLGSGNRVQFSGAVSRSQTGGGTPLRDAVRLGSEALEKQAQKQLGYGEYHMVVVTDGEATPRDQDPTGIVNKILKKTPIVIHTIGFCIGDRHSLNQPGKTVYRAANNPAELTKGLEDVLAESESFDVSDFEA